MSALKINCAVLHLVNLVRICQNSNLPKNTIEPCEALLLSLDRQFNTLCCAKFHTLANKFA